MVLDTSQVSYAPLLNCLYAVILFSPKPAYQLGWLLARGLGFHVLFVVL